jgi:hypothetical protein
MMLCGAQVFATMGMRLVTTGCDGGHRVAQPQSDKSDIKHDSQDDNTLPSKTFAGVIEIDKLPPHFGLTVSLAFFPVSGANAPVPYNGDPPAGVETECPELYSEVDLDTEIHESKRTIPFSLEHASGHYYLQLRTILYRKQDGKVFAQAEQFFFRRRPLALIDDLPSVTLPVEWPSIPLDELGHYRTVYPQKGQ